jgi:hypothetical protein
MSFFTKAFAAAAVAAGVSISALGGGLGGAVGAGPLAAAPQPSITGTNPAPSPEPSAPNVQPTGDPGAGAGCKTHTNPPRLSTDVVNGVWMDFSQYFYHHTGCLDISISMAQTKDSDGTLVSDVLGAECEIKLYNGGVVTLDGFSMIGYLDSGLTSIMNGLTVPPRTKFQVVCIGDQNTWPSFTLTS